MKKHGIRYWLTVVQYRILTGWTILPLVIMTYLPKKFLKHLKRSTSWNSVTQAGLRQQYIDQSVSLNLAFPSEATPKWLNKVHMEAWKKGVKTLYYTRTESVLRGDIAAASNG